jgi:hypothetical protein
MGLCALQINQKKWQDKIRGVGIGPDEAAPYSSSEVFHKLLSWGSSPGNYTKVLGQGQHRRILLTPHGDPAIKQKDFIAEYESQQFEKLKQQQAELLKQ